MTDEIVQKPSDLELLKDGMMRLDDALASIMELDCAGAQALAHFLHSALSFGEKLIESIDAQ